MVSAVKLFDSAAVWEKDRQGTRNILQNAPKYLQVQVSS